MKVAESLQDATWYTHFPELRLSGAFEILGGHLTHLAFDEFEALDRDWARRSYFHKAQPIVWRRSGKVPFDPLPDLKALSAGKSVEAAREAVLAALLPKRATPFELTCRRDAELVYVALVLAIGEVIPDPRESVSYLRQSDQRVYRRIGIRDRSALLHGAQRVRISARAAGAAAGLAIRLQTRGFSLSDSVFGPLRAVALAEAAEWPSEMVALPIMVAIEALLLGERVSGITQTLVKRVDRLLTPSLGTAALCREAYAWRSDLIHGRELPARAYPELAQRLRELAFRVVGRAVEILIQANASGNDLGALRRSLA